MAMLMKINVSLPFYYLPVKTPGLVIIEDKYNK